MADITKIRALHDFRQNFKVDNDYIESLAAQLSKQDQTSLNRFLSGFEIEDWFESIFGIMPWTTLLHGLSQRQVPSHSKAAFQVPDFEANIETSALNNEPLLIEVKRVSGKKQTLKLRKSQVTPTQKYASMKGVPLVYAIYWDLLHGWTLNTLDSFKNNSSTFKISLLEAFEYDCSLIFGNVSYLITQQVHRVQVFSTEPFASPPVIHETFGALVSDQVTIDNKTYSLNGVETVVLDSMFSFSETNKSSDLSNTTIRSETRDIFCFKLSDWITRYLILYKVKPDEKFANSSAHIIMNLMKKLDIPSVMMYPIGRSPELIELDSLYLQIGETT
ncbi:MAG TPA: hypothetical protein DCY03_21115 [Planctomycetaceae bacterium]|nr:hypothetical protein [Planctomycetaceae bacterium]|tara:strand:+ start:1867 stop:2862 length:996 start_codon:yes stop_codon:yes gene_type:complete